MEVSPGRDSFAATVVPVYMHCTHSLAHSHALEAETVIFPNHSNDEIRS